LNKQTQKEGFNMGIEESLEKIMKKLELLELKLDELSSEVRKMKGSSTSNEYDDSPKPQSQSENFKSPSEILYEKQEDKTPTSPGGRLKCSKCGSVNVQTVDNKDKVVSASGGIAIYAKRHYCKKCGYQWE
jgi:hypothetical protein